MREDSHGVGRGFGSVAKVQPVVKIGHVALDGSFAEHKPFRYLSVSPPFGYELQYFHLTPCQASWVLCCLNRLRLNLLLACDDALHQRLHTKLCGDGEGVYRVSLTVAFADDGFR